MRGFVTRSTPGSGCNPLPISCDLGFVHRNSGILNRAAVLLAGNPGGAAPVPPIAGIGRAKVTSLAFMVITSRLTPFARFLDVALGSRDLVDTFVSRGTIAIDGSVFTQADADQVPNAFNIVGVSPDLISGWAEPEIGFSGTDTIFGSGERTGSGCTITNVVGDLQTPSGTLNADLSAATALPATVSFAGSYGITMVPPSPIGGTLKRHAVSWFSGFGEKPSFSARIVEAAPPAGAVNCVTAPGSLPVERTTASSFHEGFLGAWGSGTTILGNLNSAMNLSCRLRKTEVELVTGSGSVIAGPSNSASDRVLLGYVLGAPVYATRTATLTVAPAGPPDLSGTIAWKSDAGTNVRFRLRYFIDQPTGIACTP